MREIVVKVENVSMKFRMTKNKIDSIKEYCIKLFRGGVKYSEFLALDSISFNVYKGERLGIIGHNGAGKSTLLKIIAGVMKPTNGKVSVLGSIAPLLELGAGFDGEFTGQENIYLNGAILGKNKKELDAAYDKIVEFANLGEFLYMPIKNYSSGMRAKLGFSIATSINPDILILDEVLGVGDRAFKKKSSAKMMDMINDGKTVIMVSHSIGQIKKICDRVIWLHKGKIKDMGDPERVCKEYSNFMDNL
jgi:ABC-type polysaccharide/polyol phosphate transport system ATPase subunit